MTIESARDQATAGGVTPPGAATRKPRKPAARHRYQLGVRVGQVGLWIVLLGGWELAARAIPTLETLVSSPTLVAGQLIEWFRAGAIWDDIAHTLRGAILGYAFGVVAACAAVAVSWPVEPIRRFLAPFIVILNALPKVSLAPLFILWFGIGTTTAVVLVMTTIFLIIYLNVFAGLSSIDPVYVQNARALGADGSWLVRTVYVPAVLGWLMTSLRVSAIWAVLGASLAEFLAGTRGLGYLLARGNMLADAGMLAAAATLLAALSLIADRVLAHVERRFSRWRVF